MLARPASVEDFLRCPTAEEWAEALAHGWAGPDGSTASTDLIFGVRIGVTSPDYAYAGLPANRHDWWYLLGRTFELPEEYRAAADCGYRDLCIARLRAHLEGPVLALGIARCHARYVALRLGARYAWTRRAARLNAAWSGSR